ncbi:MAG: alpha/beta hydrolase, partial [Myxococcales bacterium]|nr:alpha/beta hydrolase [Myxococcales bacterium]
DAPDRMIDLGDCKLPYWKIGRGPDLVFVHGWPLNAGTWRNVVDALKADFTCHVIDLPRAGQSQWTEATPGGVKGLSRALGRAVGALDVPGRFLFVAHDSGGGFARAVAAQMPDWIAGLALGNTEIPGFHPWRLTLMLALRKPLQMFFPLSLRTRLGRWLLLRDCVTDTRLIEGELSPRFIAPLTGSKRLMDGAMDLVHTLKAADFDAIGDAHPKITAPVRLVWGAKDPWFPLKHARGMVDSFGGPCELVVIDDAKLLVHEEHPQRFAAEVRTLAAQAAWQG